MRAAAAKLIAHLTLSVAALSSQLLAQTTPVYTDPTGTQTINQPSGTGFGVSLTKHQYDSQSCWVEHAQLEVRRPGI
jgi:hypothetical protein